MNVKFFVFFVCCEKLSGEYFVCFISIAFIIMIAVEHIYLFFFVSKNFSISHKINMWTPYHREYIFFLLLLKIVCLFWGKRFYILRFNIVHHFSKTLYREKNNCFFILKKKKKKLFLPSNLKTHLHLISSCFFFLCLNLKKSLYKEKKNPHLLRIY